nr:hypothetical protein [Tanacetum cinerariifolium]
VEGTIANDANMNDLQFKLDNFQKNQQDFQEKFEQMQDDLLNQMRNFMQNLHNGPPGVDKEHEAITETELPSTEDIQPLPVQEPPQDSDIFSEEQKQSMEDTMLELVKICQEKEFLCIHDDIDDLIKSALNSKLLLINSNSQQCDLPISENSPVCDNHSDIFFDSNIDDDILVYDNDFEEIEYIEASLSDPENVSIEEENSKEEENVRNKMHKAFPLPGESSHWQYKFPLP